MKHHINIIILALRFAIAAAGFMALFQLGAAFVFLTQNEPDTVKDFFGDYFTPLASNMPYRNNEWFGGAFCIIYAGLLIYAIIGTIRFYKCLLRIEKGKMFYSTQGHEFCKAGAAIIIFAKCRYLLFCTMGSTVYFDLTIFFRELPSFLAIYLVGKLILLMSYMAEKGEFIQEENELTI